MTSIDELFLQKSASDQGNKFKGTWHCIQWTPEVTSQERVNLGVAFVSYCGEKQIQFVQDFTRLNCMYGSDAEYNARLACRIAQIMFENEDESQMWKSLQVNIVNGGFAQGDEIFSILSSLMADVVPLSRPHVKAPRFRRSPITQKRAYSRIDQYLSEELGDDYREYVPKNPKVKTALGFELFLPFRRGGNKEVATIVSADFTKAERVQSELYLGHRDISIAGADDRYESGSIFILQPYSNMNNEDYRAAKKEVQDFTHYVRSLRIPYEVGEDIEELNVKVRDWCLHKEAS